MNTLADKLIRALAVILVLLSFSVSIPLAINTWREGGGPWGFGIAGLPVLIPLSAYLLFGVAGLFRRDVRRREYFIGANILTLVAGIVSFIIFPVYPVVLSVIPVALATVGIINKRHFRFFLFLMISLGIITNIVLLKWELEFDRTLPLLQLFERANELDP